MPSPEALKMVGDAFLAKDIHVHFDVGPDEAATYVTAIQGMQWTALPPPKTPNGEGDNYYIVPAGAARGGELLREPECVIDPVTGPTSWCSSHFRYFPGTVGYKFGLELIRNAPVKDNGDELTSSGDADDWDAAAGDSTTKRRRFDGLRSSLVHYSLYAHARGRPKAFPCVKNELPRITLASATPAHFSPITPHL